MQIVQSLFATGYFNDVKISLLQEGCGQPSKLNIADSDEAGRLFQGEAGHLFRFHSGQCSDLKPDTLLV
jgi:hypothetical protein